MRIILDYMHRSQAMRISLRLCILVLDCVHQSQALCISLELCASVLDRTLDYVHQSQAMHESHAVQLAVDEFCPPWRASVLTITTQ